MPGRAVFFRGFAKSSDAAENFGTELISSPSPDQRAETTEGLMVGLIVWLVIGGVVGWLASIVMRTDAQQGIFLNIIVGIVGAFIGGWLFGGGGINGAITPMTFLVSLVGAIILLALVNLVRRGSLR
jgi:uncharacterized membrane protein YeaQ/YmgE (transglycosylase-associated protein family)